MIRVLVVDDQPLLREGVIGMLRGLPDIEAVGEADSGPTAVEAVERLGPDVVLMDVRMPGGDGIEAAHMIAAGPRSPAVIMLSTFDLDEYLIDSFSAGVAGYLLKDIGSRDLADAIRAAHRGDAALSPKLGRRLMTAYGRREPDVEEPTPLPEEDEHGGVVISGVRLTERELHVLRDLISGKTNRAIATSLNIAPTTVKTHISRMLAKLGLDNRVQLTRWGTSHNLFP